MHTKWHKKEAEETKHCKTEWLDGLNGTQVAQSIPKYMCRKIYSVHRKIFSMFNIKIDILIFLIHCVWKCWMTLQMIRQKTLL